MKKAGSIGLFIAGTTALAAAFYLYRKQQLSNNNITMNSNTNLPRGYRNNNPLNIRYSTSNTWLGKVYPNTDGAFEQFSSMQYGYRAALYLIRKYIAAGYNTVGEIITKWAPETENNTAKYIQRVCNTTGFTSGTTLTQYDRSNLCKLVYAMAIVENGNVSGHPDMNTIEQAYNLL